jgi:NAD(P)-dependent dehydrogenase (short-subunit alcohol dehydrogenase family)
MFRKTLDFQTLFCPFLAHDSSKEAMELARKGPSFREVQRWRRVSFYGIFPLLANTIFVIGENDDLPEGTVDGWRKMLDVNVIALCLCSRETVKSIKDRKADMGHIININRYVPIFLLVQS